MTSSPEQVIARLAGAQRTIVGHEQLEAAGIQRHAISYRVKNGSLHVVFRGVYSVVSGPLPPLALELAALIACGDKSFISHRSAAYVWGLIEAPPAQVEVSVVGRCCRSREGLRVRRLKAIDRRDIQRHEGLWISTPARALLEIAAASSFDELADAVNAGVGKRLVTPREVETVRKRNAGRRGAARFAAVIGDKSAATITRSRAERAFWKLLRDARLPVPEVNQRLGPYLPDFMWREQRLIVEIDSYQFHAGPRGFHNDHDKDLFYREAGFDVLRPTRNHVVYQPARVLVSLVRGLSRRSGK